MLKEKISSLIKKIIFWPRLILWTIIIIVYLTIVIIWYVGVLKYSMDNI